MLGLKKKLRELFFTPQPTKGEQIVRTCAAVAWDVFWTIAFVMLVRILDMNWDNIVVSFFDNAYTIQYLEHMGHTIWPLLGASFLVIGAVITTVCLIVYASKIKDCV